MRNIFKRIYDLFRGPRGHVGAQGQMGAPGISCHERVLYLTSTPMCTLNEEQLKLAFVHINAIRPLNLRAVRQAQPEDGGHPDQLILEYAVGDDIITMRLDPHNRTINNED